MSYIIYDKHYACSINALYMLLYPFFSVFVWMGENVSNTLCADVYIFENGGKTSPSKIIKKIVQIIMCPILRHVAELKLSLLLL